MSMPHVPMSRVRERFSCNIIVIAVATRKSSFATQCVQQMSFQIFCYNNNTNLSSTLSSKRITQGAREKILQNAL